MDLLAGLNPPQQRAVEHFEGPLLLLAGAGSGKTRVVTHRIGHLVEHHGVAPEHILAVTFTNKAASEMKERVRALLSHHPGAAPTVSTFHSFCVRLLRKDGGPVAAWRPGFTRQFLIYDDDDQLTLLKSLYKEHAIDEKQLPPRNVLSAISRAKNRGETPEDLARAARDPVTRQVASLFEQYEAALVGANALDFDSLLLEPVRLLKNHEPTRRWWNSRIGFLMIDEYQDTNRPQYELMRLLTSSHSNVCVVGDEDQSIYSWRGADIRNILDFERDYANATVIRLEQNYRSTKTVLEAASSLIACNSERLGKWLWTEAGEGEKITVYEAPDGENEALWVAAGIERLMRLGEASRAAVLYRTNAQSRQFEEALRRYRLPYHVVGGLSFYQRAEIKDVLAYLKLLLVPSDPVSFLRIVNVPARGVGKTTVDQIESFARAEKLPLWDAALRMLDRKILPVRAEAAVTSFRSLIEGLRSKLTVRLHELIGEVLEQTGYKQMLEEDKSPGAESRLENLGELLNAAAEASERGETVADFLDHAALISEADQIDTAAKVSLLTVHNAKGLEFPAVFLAGLEEGLFPHSRSTGNPALMEEERRLCYVGITRAEKRLFLSHARARRRYGAGSPETATPSRFLAEIPEHLCRREGLSGLDREGFEGPGEVDLYSERRFVRESARSAARLRDASARQPYQGKTYNSLENIAGFFHERGIPAGPLQGQAGPAVRARETPPASKAPAAPKPARKRSLDGATVHHPKYGRGTVVRKEGEGGDAKLTVMFPGRGLVKLVAKYAGIQFDE